jgi:hypothetical protein
MLILSLFNTGSNIMSTLLAITFCSVLTCEEYVVDGGKASSLTRSDCTERLQEERKFLMSNSVEEAYQEYMTLFKAEHMDGEAVDWEINCVPE